MIDYKSVEPSFGQVILRKSGMFASERLSIDLYYLIEEVDMLISVIGEKNVIDEFSANGKDFNDFEKKFHEIKKAMGKIKPIYDMIEDKKFEKKDSDLTKVQRMLKKTFIKNLTKLSLMQRNIYDAWVILTRKTNLIGQSIPSDAFKVLENKNLMKLELDKAKERHIERPYDGEK